MLDDTDRRYLRLAVELSQDYRADQRRRPFGALVVVAGQVAGRGVNQVVELADPTAHAEVMALRAAASALGRHALDDGVLYSSAEPCPMCFAASYWAAIPRIVFAATTSDVARTEFADRQLYEQLRKPAGRRSIREDPGDEAMRAEAVAVLRDWRSGLGPDAPARTLFTSSSHRCRAGRGPGGIGATSRGIAGWLAGRPAAMTRRCDTR